MTFRKRNGWQFFRFYKRTISSGELHGCFQMMSYISVGILTGFLCLEFGELLVMPHC
ncbi:hypothetical protein Goshw_025497 [Gossypium schwendimanii]|uniref:Uncharacterized protein n=1 Tax=Gossypium schwendimanii TaxID=34291 RepID=A0A7J9NDT8_GOSSC|nr:hypothetical protein [Gossypium schwendimanii]